MKFLADSHEQVRTGTFELNFNIYTTTHLVLAEVFDCITRDGFNLILIITVDDTSLYFRWPNCENYQSTSSATYSPRQHWWKPGYYLVKQLSILKFRHPFQQQNCAAHELSTCTKIS